MAKKATKKKSKISAKPASKVVKKKAAVKKGPTKKSAPKKPAAKKSAGKKAAPKKVVKRNVKKPAKVDTIAQTSETDTAMSLGGNNNKSKAAPNPTAKPFDGSEPHVRLPGDEAPTLF